MICDHVAGISWFSPVTGANRFVTSAAEGFVLLAGLVIGLVYGPRIARSGWSAAADPILRRAAVLYGVTVGLTLLFVGLFQFTELKLWLDRAYGLGLDRPDPADARHVHAAFRLPRDRHPAALLRAHRGVAAASCWRSTADTGRRCWRSPG